MREDRFARLKLGVVEQHMLDSTEGNRNGRTDGIDAGRCGNQLSEPEG